MNRRVVIVGILVLMAASFIAGSLLNGRSAPGKAASGRKILHYVDPMHPSYTSDKPGIAPDCGMPLEPVYADGTMGSSAATGNLPPGAVQISADRQQLIGVRVAPVEKSPARNMVRFAGRVVPDETRSFVINATIDGWITKARTVTTGSIVREEEVLATFYSPEFLSASSALLFALGSMDRVQALGAGTPQNQVQKDQLAQFNVSLQQYKDALRNLGMGRRQIEDMIKTRKYAENIDITSPSHGVILSRNVSDGQRFVKGEQLFKIGDLRHVWVLIDVYQSDADLFKPGMPVKVSLAQRQRTFSGRVSTVPPIFDPVSKTLKVRVNVDNPGMILRPDMFVDVELPITIPAMLSVPMEAVLDSGLKKTVYVEKSPGVFEPREVATGRTAGSRVEIVSGLMVGERVAVSGTFLLDSESRMKTAASGITGTPQQDPVCGMYLDEAKARSKWLFIESGGTTSFFCSEDCKKKFKPATVKTAAAKGETKPAQDHSMHKGHEGHDGAGMKMPAESREHQDKPAPPEKPMDHGKEHKHD